jgi:hypothetical protein
MAKENDKLNRLKTAFSLGAPLKTALNFAGVSLSEYRYWEKVANSVSYCIEKEGASKLQGKKDVLARIRKETHEEIAEQEAQPDPELVALYLSSGIFKREANEIYNIFQECEKAKTDSVIHHLKRVSTSTNNAEISASEWFLERALPDEFGKNQEEKPTPIKPVEIKFVNSKSEESLKRIEALEKELSGEGNKA